MCRKSDRSSISSSPSVSWSESYFIKRVVESQLRRGCELTVDKASAREYRRGEQTDSAQCVGTEAKERFKIVLLYTGRRHARLCSARKDLNFQVQILLKAQDWIVKFESDSQHIQKELHHHTSRHNKLRRTLNELAEESDSDVDY